MIKKFLFLIFVFLIFLNQTISQESLPKEVSFSSVEKGIDPETGLPREVLPIKNLGESMSDEEKRTAYLKAEWQKILEKSEVFGPWIKFLEKLNPVSNFLLGIPISFSWFFFLTTLIWIALVVFIFRVSALFELTKWLHVLISLFLVSLMTYYRYPRSIGNTIVGIISLMSAWWMQYLVVGIVILIIILATYFSKQIEKVGKWIKEKNEKNMEELEKKEFREDIKLMESFRKSMSK